MSTNFAQYIEESLTQGQNDNRLANSRSSLPALFALLGTKPFKDSSPSSPEVKRFAVNVFEKKLKPSDVLDDGSAGTDWNAAAEKMVIAAGKAKGIDIKPEEAHEIVQIIETGEFFNDISSSTAAVTYCIPGLPLAIFSDAKNALSPKIVVAVLRDLSGTVRIFTSLRAVESILEDLQDGRFDHPPKVMTHTLKELYQKATVRKGLDTVHQLYARDNRSVRLATILYARSNGIDLTEDDIDLALSTALNRDNPDLGPALARAGEKYAQRLQNP